MSSVSDPARVRATPLRRDPRQPDNRVESAPSGAELHRPPLRPHVPAPAAIAARNLPEPPPVAPRGSTTTSRPYEPWLRGLLSAGFERAHHDTPGLKRSTIALGLGIEPATLEIYAKPSRTEVIPGDRLVQLLCGGVLDLAPRTLEWLWARLAKLAGFIAVREPVVGAGAELSICELAADVGRCAQQLAECRAASSAGGENITPDEFAALAGRADEVIRAGLRLRVLCENLGCAGKAVRP
jgi:hypothetical protein